MTQASEELREVLRLDRAVAVAAQHANRIKIRRLGPGRVQIGGYLVYHAYQAATRTEAWQVAEIISGVDSPPDWPATALPVLFDSTDPESAVIDAACHALEDAIAAQLEGD